MYDDGFTAEDLMLIDSIESQLSKRPASRSPSTTTATSPAASSSSSSSGPLLRSPFFSAALSSSRPALTTPPTIASMGQLPARGRSRGVPGRTTFPSREEEDAASCAPYDMSRMPASVRAAPVQAPPPPQPQVVLSSLPRADFSTSRPTNSALVAAAPSSFPPPAATPTAPTTTLSMNNTLSDSHAPAPTPLSLFVVSECRFGCADGSTARIKQLLAATPGGVYEKKERRWTFPFCEYESFLQRMREVPLLRVNVLPPSVREVFVERTFQRMFCTDEALDVSRLPPDLYETLLPYQKEGVRFGVSRGGRCLIADEMGLGKTMQAIAIASYYRSAWPLLIIAPSSMRLQWCEELLRWHPELDRDEHVSVMMKGSTPLDKLVNVVSYDLAARHHQQLNARRFGVVIADESHMLKNSKAKRTQALVPVLRNVKHVLLLTGTPALSRPVELFTQINLLNQRLFGHFHDYGVRYCDGKRNRFGWDYLGASNLPELHQLLSATIMVRRLKSEVLTQLPAKTRSQVFVAMAAQHQQTLAKVLRDMKSQRRLIASDKLSTKRQASQAAMEQFAVLQELWKDTGTAKLPAVLDWINDRLVNDDGSFLIFAYHQNVINGVCLTLDAAKVEYIRIDGNTPGPARIELVNYFQTRPSCRVAVLSITAAGCGITLTKAACVVFAELYWNPGALRQCEDRAHRIGQNMPVEVFYLIARGSIDEAIWSTVSRKLEVLGEALNGVEESLQIEARLDREHADIVDSFYSRAADPSHESESLVGQILDSIAGYDERKARQEERQRLKQQNQLAVGAQQAVDLFPIDIDVVARQSPPVKITSPLLHPVLSPSSSSSSSTSSSSTSSSSTSSSSTSSSSTSSSSSSSSSTSPSTTSSLSTSSPLSSRHLFRPVEQAPTDVDATPAGQARDGIARLSAFVPPADGSVLFRAPTKRKALVDD